MLEESVMSFLLQDYPNKELLIITDCPGQELVCDYPNVRVLHMPERAKSLSDKIQFAIDSTDSTLFCRWDDDDISLPHRLKYSMLNFRELNWKPTSYIWFPIDQEPQVVVEPANTHVMALWDRVCLNVMGGYPPNRTGDEDQMFDQRLLAAGVLNQSDIPPADIFYVYRWGVSKRHLSGNPNMRQQWIDLNRYPQPRRVVVHPKWCCDWVQFARRVVRN